MIRSFKLALGLTTCLNGITAAEAKQNPLAEEAKRQKFYISRIAAKKTYKAQLFNNRTRPLKSSQNVIPFATRPIQRAPLFRAARFRFSFTPHFHGFKSALLKKQGMKFSFARKVITRKAVPVAKRAPIIKKKLPVAYKSIPIRAVLKAPPAKIPAVNDNKNNIQKTPIAVIKANTEVSTQLLNTASLIASKVMPLEAPREVEASIEATSVLLTSAPAHEPSSTEPATHLKALSEPALTDSEKSTSGTVLTSPDQAEEPADNVQVRNEVISNIDKIRTVLSGVDLDTLAVNEQDTHFFNLTHLTPSIIKILSNDNAQTKGKSLPQLSESLNRLNELLTNGNIDYNTIGYVWLVRLKAFSTTLYTSLKSVISATEESKKAQLVSTVRGKLDETRDLLKDFKPGVTLVTVEPKDVPLLKESLWDIKGFLRNDKFIPKGGIVGFLMDELISEAKLAINDPNLNLVDNYVDLVRAKYQLNTILEKLKFGQPEASPVASISSEPVKVATVEPSSPKLSLVERAKPIFSRLDALLADPNVTISQEHEGMMNSIIGQFGLIKDVRGSVDSNDNDRPATLRKMIANLSQVSDIPDSESMSLSLSLSRARDLLNKMGQAI